MTEKNETALEELSNTIECIATGVPAPIRKNLFKAINQLCTAIIDVPTAYFEGISAEIRETTEARKQLIKKQAENFSEQIVVPEEYSIRANANFSRKIIKEQANLDRIALNATHELADIKQNENIVNEPQEISEDWLNVFENLGRSKSSEEMQVYFGRILAGEIVKPGSFSLKTLRIFSELNIDIATNFQKICNFSISVRKNNKVSHAVLPFSDNNSKDLKLRQIGLSIDDILHLEHYGLIIWDNSLMFDMTDQVYDGQSEEIPLIRFQDKNFRAIPSDNWRQGNKKLIICSIPLSISAIELLDIVPLKYVNLNVDELKNIFKLRNIDLIEEEYT